MQGLQPAGVPILNFNGLQYPTSGLIKLSGVTQMGAGSTYTTLRNMGASAGYQVTAGKTFYCVGAIVRSNVSIGISLLYGDTDVGLNYSGSAPTNAAPAYSGANTAVLSLMTALGTAPGAVDATVNLLGARIPAGKYPAIVNATTGSGGTIFVVLFGYEA